LSSCFFLLFLPFILLSTFFRVFILLVFLSHCFRVFCFFGSQVVQGGSVVTGFCSFLISTIPDSSIHTLCTFPCCSVTLHIVSWLPMYILLTNIYSCSRSNLGFPFGGVSLLHSSVYLRI
jgi:hypothetical protein